AVWITKQFYQSRRTFRASAKMLLAQVPGLSRLSASLCHSLTPIPSRFTSPSSLPSAPHAGAAAILVDELDAGFFQRAGYAGFHRASSRPPRIGPPVPASLSIHLLNHQKRLLTALLDHLLDRFVFHSIGQAVEFRCSASD